ncbi:MAG TPA: Mur ligase family protein [Gemmatimonadales bacterium]|nr:Mur ligase family protein [Gemmatimonadales bacterium]
MIESPPPAEADRITLIDSRRLMGPNLFGTRVGAVLDVAMADADAEGAMLALQAAARAMLSAVGWEREDLLIRRFPGGASLKITAPVDALLAATEINEWALAAANAALAGLPAPDLAAGATNLRLEIAAERKPRIQALSHRAEDRGVAFLLDDDQLSLGSGTGCQTWPLADAPDPAAIDWSLIHDVPTVLVTGSNGKTTTVRLLASLLARTGITVGYCCSDTVTIGNQVLAQGDWSGPAGARLVLRDRRTETAVLETARGGLLRRGLAMQRATAAIVTNIAEDHFGEFGIADLGALAEAKLTVRRALGPDGTLVLNAEDPELVKRAPRDVRVTWFALDPSNPELNAGLASGGTGVTIVDGAVVIKQGGQTIPLLEVAAIPITLKGAARHNVANALGVVALADALGVRRETIIEGLIGFGSDPASNPGRLNLFTLNGITVLVDFAHNPHGMAALVEVANALPAKRRLVILGQAGNRDNHALEELARSAWAFRPDRIILKEMEKYRRGREIGEIPGIMRQEFLRLGAHPATIVEADSEYAAVITALEWARPGDLLLLPVHSERDRVLALLKQRTE